MKTKETKNGWIAISHKMYLPKDRVILALWKGRPCLACYDEDDGRWYIVWDPFEMNLMMVSQNREGKFTHYMDLPREPDYPEDYILEESKS